MVEMKKEHINKYNLPFAATGIILAGGKSSRMGRDKSMLPLADSGESMLKNIWNGLIPLCKEILICGNSSDKYKLPDTVEISDIYKDRGPLSGIHAGLKRASYDYSFIVSCDMANFNQELAAFLLSKCDNYDLIIPQHNGLFEPLFAVYHKNTLDIIEKKILSGENRVQKIIAEANPLIIDDDEIKAFGDPKELFKNINTPEDYQKINEKFKRGNHE